MAWSTDASNTAPSTLHVTNTAPFSHRITQQTYATVFYSVIRAKTDLRRSPSSLRVGLVKHATYCHSCTVAKNALHA